MKVNNAIENIIRQMEEIHEGRPWIGSTFQRKLARVDEDAYFTQPLPDMHSVAEIMSHLTLWRSEAVLKIKTGKGSKTDDCEENWPTNETLAAQGWDAVKSAYDQTLDELIALLRNKDDSFLEEEYYDTDFRGNYTYRWLLNGMVQHDAYHLGQLGLVIKYLLR